ncbi:hypothetical protein LSCM1_04429 [Leishmania martiniquensis]|uniref:Protein kinase domain-containing protein n=1 Tax=Leishmania martiniquensis TaxID=1580590 RepID=A0A836GK60_9TRYP|nr:hypothetical protein LSCM1_04429 [Leishmania martiniquensis]
MPSLWPSSSAPLGSISSSLVSPSRHRRQHQQPAPARLNPSANSSTRVHPENSTKGVTCACAPPLLADADFARERTEEPEAKRHHAESSSCPAPGGSSSASSAVVRRTAATAATADTPSVPISVHSSSAASSSSCIRSSAVAGCPVVWTRGAGARLPASLEGCDGSGSVSTKAAPTASTHSMAGPTAKGVSSSLSLGVTSSLRSAAQPSLVPAGVTRIVCSHPKPTAPSTVLVTNTGAPMTPPMTRLAHRIHQHELRPADFRREEVLGAGSYSIVTLATHCASGLLFALKEIDRSRLRWRPLEAQLRWEINLQRTLRHAHIVRLYSYFITPECISLVLEYCSGGTLLNRLRAAPHHRFSERQASRYTRHVAKALAHLHGLGVAHRDLKPENVLISADGIAKLADFGWSRSVVHPSPLSGSAATAQAPHDQPNAPRDSMEHDASSENAKEGAVEGRRTMCGTLDYLSPEMVSGQAHSAKTDVWSLGVMLAEMLTGMPPFYTESTQQTLRAIQRLPPNLTGSHITDRGPGLPLSGTSVTANVSSTYNEPAALSAGALSLIRAMLQKDPAARPTMSEVLCHPWLQKAVRNE